MYTKLDLNISKHGTSSIYDYVSKESKKEFR